MFIEIDGNKVFALSFGAGPRTFLAHSGWVGNFEDWVATLAPLSGRWRTVVYDHRGAGETQVPLEAISVEALVEDVFRVMDALAIDRYVLGGFSRGVDIVLRAVLRHPERFDGLVLMNGRGDVVAPDGTTPPRVPPSRWPGQTHTERLRWFAERSVPEADSEHIRRWAVDILSRSPAEVAERLLTMDAESIDWPNRLSQLTLPALLIHGDKDPFCHTPTMHYLHSLFRDGKLVIREETGHLPAMARPHDVAREIDAFLDGLPG